MSEDTVTDRQGLEIGPSEVLKLLPHRFPFLLVDRAHNYVAMKSIRGAKCVTFNEAYFQGHFPNYPIMPGVLIIEALAQTGALLMSKSLNVDVARHTVFFTSVDKARFRHPVRPGDVLDMPVEVRAARSGLFKFRGQAFVGPHRAAEAEFAAKVVEVEQ